MSPPLFLETRNPEMEIPFLHEKTEGDAPPGSALPPPSLSAPNNYCPLVVSPQPRQMFDDKWKSIFFQAGMCAMVILNIMVTVAGIIIATHVVPLAKHASSVITRADVFFHLVYDLVCVKAHYLSPEECALLRNA